MIRHSGNLNFGAGQIEMGGHDEQGVALRGKDSFSDGNATEQWLVKTGFLDALQTK